MENNIVYLDKNTVQINKSVVKYSEVKLIIFEKYNQLIAIKKLKSSEGKFLVFVKHNDDIITIPKRAIAARSTPSVLYLKQWYQEEVMQSYKRKEYLA